MYGASPSASSIAVIPIDQMSAEKSYPLCCSITSGAIQQGDPTKVFLFSPFFILAETPKSPRYMAPLFFCKHVACLDVPVDLPVFVEVVEALQDVLEDRRDDRLVLDARLEAVVDDVE
eukprot:CAMPEP_0168324202 /NCGR_PEP_ID=MMETSP0213-20121227/3946_1 /TAXON_ID=151035 /ORGANISM="Euplotes harpa, Strain FSP1.4" /LENGTH=117 /DNA_ID=CAMNT_0008326439 /DNA_START=556 /DNA_END=909 /DNA_ORIENTATION=-